ncbi:MAG: hypothetical protein EBX50_09440, partial [Chitinophagia bacterium]|nr:hypothetical protein [Chitinophagia bacterium]
VNNTLTVVGSTIFANTIFTTTSALSVINTGLGPALYVRQGPGPGDIASFYDADGIEALHIGDAKYTLGQDPDGVIGIKTSFPNKALTVVGAISATESIYTTGKFLSAHDPYTVETDLWDLFFDKAKGEAIYSDVSPNSADWESVYSTTQTYSGSWGSGGTQGSSAYTTVNANSANWNSVYTTTQDNSAGWESVESTVNTNSGRWESVYTTTQNNSAGWESVESTVNTNSGKWESVYTTTQNNSAGWESVESTVNSNSGRWESVYTTTQNNSAGWESVESTVNSNSGSWESVYTTTQNNSAGWESVESTVNTNSGKWESVYTTTQNNSAGWESVESTVNTNSGRWESVYTTTQSNSSEWEAAYTDLQANSADWNSTETTVNSNSAKWESVYTTTQNNSAGWESVESTVNSNSGSWESVYTTTQNNSAGWESVESTVNSNSGRWESVYTTTQNNSAGWESAESTVNSNSGKWESVYTTVDTYSAAWLTEGEGNALYLPLTGGAIVQAPNTEGGRVSIYGGLSAATVENFVIKPNFNPGNSSLIFADNNTDRVGIKTNSPLYTLHVNGDIKGQTGYYSHIAAETKSFYIKHPSKPDMHLQYGSLESPYHGIRLTGSGQIIESTAIITLPDYVPHLVHADDVVIQLTNYQHNKDLWVDKIEISLDPFKSQFVVRKNFSLLKKPYKFFWSFTAIRKDIPLLQVEV